MLRAGVDSALLPSLAIGCLAALLVGPRLRLGASLAAGIGSYLLLRSRRARRVRREIAEREAALDETLEESFPSSAPPSLSGATAWLPPGPQIVRGQRQEPRPRATGDLN